MAGARLGLSFRSGGWYQVHRHTTSSILDGGPWLFLLLLFLTLLISSFWTSRGHRRRPFSSPVLAFNFYRA